MTNTTGKWWKQKLEQYQLHLARPDALFHMAILGLVSGVLTGLVIIAFRLLVEETQAAFFPGGDSENFEGLGWQARLLLPLGAGFVLFVLFRLFSKGTEVLGVACVMERMAYYQGHLKLRGLLLQFFGAAAAIIGGYSVGREGPHVYLGAASSSLMGQAMKLPNNSIRTLVGCGTAAGIAASFNTPLAGVIFALEVVMLEYTLASFIPVILAAASAALVSISVFGNTPAFDVPTLRFSDLTAVPLVIVLGLAAGILSSAFIQSVQTIGSRTKNLQLWQRYMLAALAASAFGYLLPQVMGIGYDSVNQALLGELGITLLVWLVIGKLLATSVCIGLGIPGGMIGPSLFIGAVLGALCGSLFSLAGFDVDPGFFALLGMGAMMGASLQAPLAALTAMMELTHSPGIIMPGMLTIITANLTASELFGKESLFITNLKARGLDYNTNPVHQALRRIGVASTMNRSYAITQESIKPEVAREILRKKPVWLILESDNLPQMILRAADLAAWLESEAGQQNSEAIDLKEIPGQRYDITNVHIQATLHEARQILDDSPAEALYVSRQTGPESHRIYGILTSEMIESSYR